MILTSSIYSHSLWPHYMPSGCAFGREDNSAGRNLISPTRAVRTSRPQPPWLRLSLPHIRKQMEDKITSDSSHKYLLSLLTFLRYSLFSDAIIYPNVFLPLCFLHLTSVSVSGQQARVNRVMLTVCISFYGVLPKSRRLHGPMQTPHSALCIL